MWGPIFSRLSQNVKNLGLGVSREVDNEKVSSQWESQEMAQVVENGGSHRNCVHNSVGRSFLSYEKASDAVCGSYVQDPDDVDDGLTV
jgi:hypothetical protein